MLKGIIFIFLLSGSFLLNAQYHEKKVKLPSELNEISGLESIHDSLCVAHNDSGNKAELFFISTNGTIQHISCIKNAKNVDWEDLTMDDKGFLYIADVGNNSNARKDLCIYKVRISDALENDSINAEIVTFRYADQALFPPSEDNLDFDCEAIFWQNDSLYLVTKSRSQPWTGIAKIYSLSTNGSDQIAEMAEQIFIGKKSWQKDAVTGSDEFGNNLCILTYQRMVLFSRENGKWKEESSYKFKRYTQKEALVFTSQDTIFIAAEKHPILGGPFLYIISKK